MQLQDLLFSTVLTQDLEAAFPLGCPIIIKEPILLDLLETPIVSPRETLALDTALRRPQPSSFSLGKLKPQDSSSPSFSADIDITKVELVRSFNQLDIDSLGPVSDHFLNRWPLTNTEHFTSHSGLYVLPSLLNHSCRPNRFVRSPCSPKTSSQLSFTTCYLSLVQHRPLRR